MIFIYCCALFDDVVIKWAFVIGSITHELLMNLRILYDS